MAYLSCSVWDRQILQELGQEGYFADANFDDRQNFLHIPNPEVRRFLQFAVEVGHLPSQRSPNDAIAFTDTEIRLQMEWLDADSCESFVDLRRISSPPALKSVEMRVI